MTVETLYNFSQLHCFIFKKITHCRMSCCFFFLEKIAQHPAGIPILVRDVNKYATALTSFVTISLDVWQT